MTINFIKNFKTYGGKRSSKRMDDNVSDADCVTTAFRLQPCQLIENEKSTLPDDQLSFSSDSDILPYQLSCCKNRIAYLVHHTLNRNGTYSVGKRNLLSLNEKFSLINRITKRTQRLD